MLKAIFFDFDGVIMDTMDHKLAAYLDALAEFAVPVELVRLRVPQLMGQSRHRIIRRLYEESTGVPMSETDFERALARFNQADEDARPNMKFLPGSIEFIQAVHQNHFTAIVTGTPEIVIRRTTAFHGLDPYFDIVRGSPDTKIDILHSLFAAQSLRPAECLFIGDGRTDQDAADAHGVRFVGVTSRLSSFEPHRTWQTVENLNELLPVMGKIPQVAPRDVSA